MVGQENGGTRTSISLQERYEEIHDISGLARRYYADSEHPARNPHMRGTTSALRVILGKGVGAAWDDEFVHTTQGERFHVFDAFALVTCCSARRIPSEGPRAAAPR